MPGSPLGPGLPGLPGRPSLPLCQTNRRTCISDGGHVLLLTVVSVTDTHTSSRQAWYPRRSALSWRTCSVIHKHIHTARLTNARYLIWAPTVKMRFTYYNLEIILSSKNDLSEFKINTQLTTYPLLFLLISPEYETRGSHLHSV